MTSVERPARRGAIGRIGPQTLLFATASAIAVCWLAFFLFAPVGRVAASFADDAFYYFGVARHLATGHGSTYNGVDATNGYHPLWLAALTPIFAIPDDRIAFVVTAAVAVACLLAAVWLVVRIGRAVHGPTAVGIGAIPLLLSGAAGPAYLFIGMEATVLIPCLLALILVFVKIDGGRAREVTARQWSLVGGVLALTLLARLDSVFTVFLFAAVVAANARRASGREAGWWRPLLGVIVVPVVVLVVYLVVNRWAFGTATPVSGQAKALGGPYFNLSGLSTFLSAPNVYGPPTYFGLLALVLTPLAWFRARAKAAPPLRRVIDGGAILLTGSLAAYAYYAVTSSWPLYPWYYVSTEVILFCCISTLVATTSVSRKVLMGVLAVGLTFTVIYVGASVARLATTDGKTHAYMQESMRIATRLNAELPPDAVVAMGDRAGVLGFYLDRPLIQLEGLVESKDYLSALSDGQVRQYLASHGVTVYARSAYTADDHPTGDPGCHSFAEPIQGSGPKASIVTCDSDLILDVPQSDGTRYRVWRYRAELNPVP